MKNKYKLNDIEIGKIHLFRNNFSFAIALILSVCGFIFFLFHTGFIQNELLIVALAFLIIYPFKESYRVIKSYIICISFIFICWLINGLGSTVFPFVFSLIIGYLLDPIVSKLEQKKIPRWLSAIGVIIIAGGIITLISIYVFPILVEQADTITKQISKYLADLKAIGNKKSTYTFFKQWGIERSTIKEVFNFDFIPKVGDIATQIFQGLLNLFLSFSDIATQLVNIIIIPFLSFYFIRDFSKIKKKIFVTIGEENIFIKYLKKFNTVLRIYIGWQIVAALIVMVVASIVYSIFSVPYGILIACIAGLLNPIPYFGSIISILIGGIVALLVNDGAFASNFAVIIVTLIGIHFINAYFLEPTIAGNKIGLHPIIMILSIFVFNSIFGVLGMLIAVPTTAVILAFCKDMYHYYKDKNKLVEMDGDNV